MRILNPRRNVIIRTVTCLGADIATGIAIASAMSWIIQFAALGIFLSFLLWLVAAFATLAFSQFVLHPMLTTALSDR